MIFYQQQTMYEVPTLLTNAEQSDIATLIYFYWPLKCQTNVSLHILVINFKHEFGNVGGSRELHVALLQRVHAGL